MAEGAEAFSQSGASSKRLSKSKAAELVCSAACCVTRRLIQRLRVNAVRRHHRLDVHHRRRHLDVHRHHRLELRAKRGHGKVRLAIGAEHYSVPQCLRWVAIRSNEKRERCLGLGRRWSDRTRDQVRRDSFLRPRSQSDGRPSRGCSPIHPMGPFPGRCRCRSSPARNSRRARRHTAHSRSSRTHSLAARRCRS